MDTIRNIIPAEARGRAYAVAAAVVTALTAFGALTEELAPAVAGVAAAVVTLAFAILHSTSPWRQAVYGLTAALGVLAVATGILTDGQADAILGIVAPLLGVALAGATAPAPADVEPVGKHAAVADSVE